MHVETDMPPTSCCTLVLVLFLLIPCFSLLLEDAQSSHDLQLLFEPPPAEDSRYFGHFLTGKVWATISSHGLNLELLSTNCSCDMHPKVTTLTNAVRICNAPLILSWILAVIIGLSFSQSILSLGPNVAGSLSYAITFAMYAFMISSGIIVHSVFLVECGADKPSDLYVDAAKIDASLTTCIAISFLFDALVDLKLIHDRNFSTVISMLCVYTWVFYAYFLDVISPQKLYFMSVLVCCSAYLVAQLPILFKNGCRGLTYLLLASLFGGVSFWLIKEDSCWLCRKLGAWSIEGVWYYGSDIAMLMIGLYVWKTKKLLVQSMEKVEKKITVQHVI